MPVGEHKEFGRAWHKHYRRLFSGEVMEMRAAGRDAGKPMYSVYYQSYGGGGAPELAGTPVGGTVDFFLRTGWHSLSKPRSRWPHTLTHRAESSRFMRMASPSGAFGPEKWTSNTSCMVGTNTSSHAGIACATNMPCKSMRPNAPTFEARDDDAM